MQRIDFDKRVTVTTEDGVKSGVMEFYLNDDGKCFVSPKISPDEKFALDTDYRWEDADAFHEDISMWREDRPRDEDGRVIPFPDELPRTKM